MNSHTSPLLAKHLTSCLESLSHLEDREQLEIQPLAFRGALNSLKWIFLVHLLFVMRNVVLTWVTVDYQCPIILPRGQHGLMGQSEDSAQRPVVGGCSVPSTLLTSWDLESPSICTAGPSSESLSREA